MISLSRVAAVTVLSRRSRMMMMLIVGLVLMTSSMSNSSSFSNLFAMAFVVVSSNGMKRSASMTAGGGGGDFLLSSSSSVEKEWQRWMVGNANDAEGEDSSPSLPLEEFKPRDDSGVTFQVQDVRDLVGSPRAAPTTSSSSQSDNTLESMMGLFRGKDQATTSSSSVASMGKNSETNYKLDDDTMQMLLRDAKEMEQQGGGAVVGNEEEEGGFKPLVDGFRKVVSTIVTIDFFFVCSLLLWFLAGIFSSYVIKDDTIQIAFNMNFQQIVQPALGILMVGSVAGSAFKGDEEDDD